MHARAVYDMVVVALIKLYDLKIAVPVTRTDCFRLLAGRMSNYEHIYFRLFIDLCVSQRLMSSLFESTWSDFLSHSQTCNRVPNLRIRVQQVCSTARRNYSTAVFKTK